MLKHTADQPARQLFAMPNHSGQSWLLLKGFLILVVKLFMNQEVELWELALESSMAATEKLAMGNNLGLYDKDMIHLVLTDEKKCVER